MRNTLLALPFAAALLGVSMLASAALAQSLPFEQVRDCLCREQALAGMREEVEAKRAAYDSAHARLEALQRDIDTPEDLRRARADGMIDADESE